MGTPTIYMNIQIKDANQFFNMFEAPTPSVPDVIF